MQAGIRHAFQRRRQVRQTQHSTSVGSDTAIPGAPLEKTRRPRSSNALTWAYGDLLRGQHGGRGRFRTADICFVRAGLPWP
ncbi:hypothetical protein SVEN_2067 [Streptomyces venezuelae ATCC 10712]|uniref:Uncharacterized protein n=1 Tax=Streptomyces venezuelae (strain ATCC 10712 / CBS 650.69 / DSM 40230 / JCM 4526 / NBRC 13096 / PD 04745) TaxID=953739 RepID=F2RKW4_STRVP|nr:hypothetical protein SVEN_2067 [Streptomyces venezuelae ATCC 10712]